MGNSPECLDFVKEIKKSPTISLVIGGGCLKLYVKKRIAMITYVNGSVFEHNTQTIVNTVNCVGVMGKGLALEFKKLYPKMFESYKKICKNKLLKVGLLQLYKTDNKWILNFPTKTDWRYNSKIEYIEAGLQKFVDTYKEKGITSITFPKLGCTNGHLDWEKDVKHLMEKYLNNLDIEVKVVV